MNIHESINAIMLEIGAVGKDKKNQQQGFNFRGVDDAMNATSHLFAKHGVFVVPQVLDRVREERTTQKGNAMYVTLCRVKYTFFATDGTFVEAIVDGEGMDTADKGTSKAQAIAFKYALFQVLDIPTEVFVDPDKTTQDETEPVRKQGATARVTPVATDPVKALVSEIKNLVAGDLTLKATVDEYKAAQGIKSIAELSEEQAKTLLAALYPPCLQ